MRKQTLENSVLVADSNRKNTKNRESNDGLTSMS